MKSIVLVGTLPTICLIVVLYKTYIFPCIDLKRTKAYISSLFYIFLISIITSIGLYYSTGNIPENVATARYGCTLIVDFLFLLLAASRYEDYIEFKDPFN